MSRTRAALTIVLATLALAACTSTPAEPSPSTPTASDARTLAPSTLPPSPTRRPASPAPTAATGADQDMTTPPVRPAGLDGPATEDSAGDVGRYFLQLFPYALATGDLEEWDALSGEECKYCAHLRALVTDVHEAGNHGTGGAPELGYTTAMADGKGGFLVAIDYFETPSRTVAPDGSVVDDFPDRFSMRAELNLRWSGSAWKVEAGRAKELGSGS